MALHSAYDPLREAARWAEGIEGADPTNYIVLGFGLGYHLLMLLKTHAKKIRSLIIIERDPRILRLALNAVDLHALLSHQDTDWIIGATPEEIPERIGARRTDIILHNCKILPHEPSVRCFPQYYQSVRKSLLDAITYDEINLRTTFENQGRNQFNILMNLPSISRGYTLQDCEGLFKGFPGIVVAAGPSLDRNIDWLRETQDRAPVLIVDTVQTTFLKKGLKADFVITGDPTPLNFSHFEKIPSLGESFLAFHPEVNRNITQKFMRHPYLLPLFDGESPLLEYLFDAAESYGELKRAMNVGHIAFNLAVHMGCAPIILVGFDFAFPKNGGTTHVKDAAVSRTINAVQADGTVEVGGKEGLAKAESGKMMMVPGYDGDWVPTTVPFSQYIQALERSIEEYGVQVIDATEGGAAFKGTSRMTFKEALEQTLGKDGASQRLNTFRARGKTADLIIIERRLREGLDAIKKGLNNCEKMETMLREWRTLLAKGPITDAEVSRQWKTFDAIWLDTIQTPHFDAVLGTSVHYLYYRRQRADPVPDESGVTFLRCMCDKYEFIISEMKGLLRHFIQVVDLSIAQLTNKGE